MKFKLSFLYFLMSVSFLNAQYSPNKFSISLDGVYTTSSKIYLNPKSSDIILKNNSFEVGTFYNPALDFRFNLYEDLILSLNIDYIKKEKDGSFITVFYGSSTVNLNMTDGFLVIPVELSLYYLMPFSTNGFKMLMGGGAAYYYGSQIRKFQDVEVSAEKRQFSYGIQAAVSMDFMLSDNLSIRGDIKFRDPQISITSKYNKTTTEYKGKLLRFPAEPFDTKINIDGLSFIVGLAYQF